jgi:hypothetical protein
MGLRQICKEHAYQHHESYGVLVVVAVIQEPPLLLLLLLLRRRRRRRRLLRYAASPYHQIQAYPYHQIQASDHIKIRKLHRPHKTSNGIQVQIFASEFSSKAHHIAASDSSPFSEQMQAQNHRRKSDIEHHRPVEVKSEKSGSLLASSS